MLFVKLYSCYIFWVIHFPGNKSSNNQKKINIVNYQSLRSLTTIESITLIEMNLLLFSMY